MECKNWTCRVLIILSLLVLGIVVVSNLFADRVKKEQATIGKKRGYILDRNYHPIAITIARYKAYYLLNNDFFWDRIPPEVKKYIKTTINLPKKGLILLSDDLSPDEAQKLSKVDHVIIEKGFKRIVLQPFMKFLIGETMDGLGISGVEKAFDNTLRKGKTVILSLSLPLEKRLYTASKRFKDCKFSAALFDIPTGEILAYVDSPQSPMFAKVFPERAFGLKIRGVANFLWEPGYLQNLMQSSNGINLWYLAKLYMESLCNRRINPTILYKKDDELCKTNISSFEKEFYINNTIVKVWIKGKRLLIAGVELEKQDVSPEVVEKRLNSIARHVL
ncbi:MAG: hypothetical protein GXO57_06440 [Thermodesulfobacteria bacterium]|nr:hypothetical protein [Thermodesulfobacteriota bacterium]